MLAYNHSITVSSFIVNIKGMVGFRLLLLIDVTNFKVIRGAMELLSLEIG